MKQEIVVKVFSATMARERARLGEDVTTWLKDHPQLTIESKEVLQSSDDAYHCLSIVLFLTKHN